MGEGPIRIIFPVFILAMWVLAGIWVGTGTWTTTNTLALIVCALSCLLVFRRFVWVFNYAYALAFGISCVVVLAAEGPSLGGWLICGLGALYGLRLFLFNRARYAADSFAGKKAGHIAAHGKIPTPVKVFVFLSVTTLMTFLSMGPYLVARTEADNAAIFVAAAVMAVGLVLETIADAQKLRSKRAAPNAPATTGLFSRVRHPNYTAEILFQAGLIIAVLGAVPTMTDPAWYEYAAGIAAPLYIIILMLSQAAAGDRSQRAAYGDDPSFRQHFARSGSLLPVPSRSAVQQ